MNRLTRWFAPLRPWWETLLGLLYPEEDSCLVCGQGLPSEAAAFPEQPTPAGEPLSSLLCFPCRRSLAPIEPPFCQLCGRPFAVSPAEASLGTSSPLLTPAEAGRSVPPLAPGNGENGLLRCSECQRPSSFVFSRSYGPYRGSLRDLLHRYKFMRERQLVPLLSTFLAAAWDRHMAALPCDVLIPVPVHPHRLRERGFNQAEELARELARYTRLPLLPALQRERHLSGQAMRGREERWQALQGAFSVRPQYRDQLSGSVPLLIDDIYTTGSTAEACSQALREAGASAVYVLTVAR